MYTQFHLIAVTINRRLYSLGNYGYMVESKHTKRCHSRVVTLEEADRIITAIQEEKPNVACDIVSE